MDDTIREATAIAMIGLAGAILGLAIGDKILEAVARRMEFKKLQRRLSKKLPPRPWRARRWL